MDNIQFLDICKKENDVLAAISSSGQKEEPSDELAFKSLIIMNDMLLDGVGDALLFASALNVLNTYVKLSKENKDTVGYSFKSKVSVLLKYIIKNPDENVMAEIQDDNGMNLALVSIYGIQFSFHNITVTDKIKCLVVKDPEHPCIKWDGIKKQSCSVTLFDFAENNSFGRTNKLLDGSDFSSYYNSMSAQFHSGEKAVSDVLSPSSHKTKEKNDSEKSSAESESSGLHAQNGFLINLECLDLESLIEKAENRSLVPELNSIYQEKTGQCLPYTSILSGKYAFQTLLSIIHASDFSPSAGVAISYDRLPSHQSFIVSFTSDTLDGISNIVCIELINWTDMKMAEDGYISVLDDYTGTYKTTIHPCSNVLSEKIGKIYTADSLPSVNFKHCILFYDAQKNEANNIVSLTDSDSTDISIFYASEIPEMIDYIGSDLEYGDGMSTALRYFSLFNSMSSNMDGNISFEYEITVQNCIDDIKSESASLSVFNYRKAKNNKDFYDYFCQQLKSSGIDFTSISSLSDNVNAAYSSTVLFNDCVPDETVLSRCKNVIVLCDLYAPEKASDDAVADLIEYAYDSHIPIHQVNIISALGFADGGNGNNFLLRCLDLSEIDSCMYIYEDYPISVFNDNNPADKECITVITIPSEIGFDANEQCLSASESEKEMVYQSLLNAPSGVMLDIKDSDLFDYVEKSLSDHADYEAEVNEKKDSISADDKYSQMIDLVKKCSENTADYNKYYAMAVKYIHKEAWVKLSEESQDWVVTAISTYYHMKDTDTKMDFSGVDLLLSKTFEVELCKRISVDYFYYMKDKYGKDYLNHLPDTFVKQTENGLKAQDPTTTTLGSMPYIMGLDSKGRVRNEKDYDNFLVYCNDILLVNPDNAENDLQELCDIIYYVRVNFRNTSAHKQSITFESATDCISYCVTDKRKLGVTMDMFRK